jgi:uncharacterized protein (TIRG00374 family)
VLAVTLYLLLPRLVDAEGTLQLLSDANYWLLGLAVVLQIVAILAYANLTHYVLRVLDIRLRLIEVLSITLSSLAVSHLLSAGGAGGWVVTYNALMKRKVPHGLIFVAIAAQQFFNYVVLWFLFAIALLYLVIARHESVLTYGGGIAAILLILGLTGYGVYLYFHRSRLRFRLGQLAALLNRISHREMINEANIDGWLDNLFAGMRRMTRHHLAIPKTAIQAMGFWLFDMLCLWVVFLAFGHGIGLSSVAVCYVVAYAIGTLAPTPGGLGAIEGLLIALFVSFGVPSATAVAVVLVYRLINFWLPIIPGLIAYVIVRPGRTPVAEGEIEQAAEEVCATPPVDMPAESCAAPDQGWENAAGSNGGGAQDDTGKPAAQDDAAVPLPAAPRLGVTREYARPARRNGTRNRPRGRVTKGGRAWLLALPGRKATPATITPAAGDSLADQGDADQGADLSSR